MAIIPQILLECIQVLKATSDIFGIYSNIICLKEGGVLKNFQSGDWVAQFGYFLFSNLSYISDLLVFLRIKDIQGFLGTSRVSKGPLRCHMDMMDSLEFFGLFDN